MVAERGTELKSIYEIKRVEQLGDYQVAPALLKQLDEVQWRLKKQKYNELVLAVNEQSVFGLALSWTNAFHPTAKYVRHYGVAPQLLDQLLEKVTPQNKVVYSCFEDETEQILLFEQKGFTLFRKTYMESIQIEALLVALTPAQLQENLRSLHEVLQNNEQRESLFKLLKFNYEQSHLLNEVADYTWQDWEGHLLGDEPDLDLSYVVVEENEVKGYIMIHKNSEDHYEVGWVGLSEGGDLQGTLKRQLMAMQNRGAKTVGIEVDTTDHFAMQLFEFMDLEQIKSWNSYVLYK